MICQIVCDLGILLLTGLNVVVVVPAASASLVVCGWPDDFADKEWFSDNQLVVNEEIVKAGFIVQKYDRIATHGLRFSFISFFGTLFTLLIQNCTILGKACLILEMN